MDQSSSSAAWWRVCLVHGHDQTKFYRQLYGKKASIKHIMNSNGISVNGDVIKRANDK